MEDWVATVERFFFFKLVFLQLNGDLCFTATSPSEPILSGSKIVANKKGAIGQTNKPEMEKLTRLKVFKS